jgi:4-amino-4-deoxychorismate lyase
MDALVAGQWQTQGAFDRQLFYADGLFETMRSACGRIPLWERHFERLQSSLPRLGLQVLDRSELEAERDQLLVKAPDAVIKLVVGPSGIERSYARSASSGLYVRWYISALPKEDPPAGIAVRIAKQRLAIQTSLAGMKILGRLEQVLAASEVAQTFDESLMRSTADDIVCATAGNVWLVVDDKLTTPIIDRCGVMGVARAEILRFATGKISISERRILPSDLQRATEVFLSNAVRGIRSVARIDGHEFMRGDISQILDTHFCNLWTS